MNTDKREVRRKLRILRHAEETGRVVQTSRYFGIEGSTFYRWRQAYAERGEAGLMNAPPIPKRHANRTPPEREEKVLCLRRNGLNRLPRGTLQKAAIVAPLRARSSLLWSISENAPSAHSVKVLA